MLELYEFFIENRNKPLGYIILAAFVFIVDRLIRKLITSQVKRLLHIDDQTELKEYVKNQRRIENKLDLLLQKEGITWDAPISETKRQVSVTKSAGLSGLRLATSTIARAAGKFIDWGKRRMSNINKGILLPLLSAIALFVKQAFGYEIPEEYIDMGANIILYGIFFVGLFMNFKKKDKPAEELKQTGKEISHDSVDFTQDTAQ